VYFLSYDGSTSQKEPALPTPSEHVMRNEEQLRDVNMRIRDVAELDISVFICECSDADCVDTLELSLEEYDRIRSVPTWFILKSGHADPTVDQVIEENGKVVVVERSTDETA
jgi:hypothetical protein